MTAPPPPLASEWNDEKTASVDWTDPEDVLVNQYTFLQLLLMHPRLEEHMRAHREEKDHARAVFMPSSSRARLTHGLTAEDRSSTVRAEQAALLKQWNAKKLLTLRSSRWCRHCGREGHTRRTCPGLSGIGGTIDANEEAAAPNTVALCSAATRRGGGDPQPAGPNIMEKLAAHQQRLERLKLLEEKKKRATDGFSQSGTGASGSRSGRANLRTGAHRSGAGGDRAHNLRPSTAGRSDGGDVFSEERRRGVIVRLDAAFNLGFVRAAELGEVKFFLSNADYGVKTMAVGDSVVFKPDSSRGYPIAIDVRPEKTVVTMADVVSFTRRCARATHPMDIITMLLTQAHAWNEVLRLVDSLRPGATSLNTRPATAGSPSTSSTLTTASTMATTTTAGTTVDSGAGISAVGHSDASTFSYTQAVHTFVELVTFVGNRDPIHLTVLSQFLRLLTTPAAAPTTAAMAEASSPSAAAGSQSTGARVCFYPDMLHAALQEDSRRAVALEADPSPESRKALAYLAEQWIEVSTFVVFLRQYTEAAMCEVRATVALLLPFLSARLAQSSADEGREAETAANTRQLELAIRRLRQVTGSAEEQGELAVRLIPSAAEFAVPPPNPDSVFSPAQLPVNGERRYTSTEAFITSQCQLLRADTFEATSRVMPATCYDLPGYTPSPETVADVEHARVFWKVRFVARVTTRDRDYDNPISYVLHMAPKSAKASMAAQLHQGTAVLISTSPDKTVISDDELFWGIISSCDSQLLRAGMVVIAPCEGSTDFAKLEANLRRNEAAGQTELSLLMETPVFMAGYASIMRALDAFVGPLSMPLPMAKLIVGPQVHDDDALCAGDKGSARANSAGEALGEVGSAAGRQLLRYIPPHCEHAFRELTKEIRGRFSLDAGQEAVMRRLPTSKVLLVQGPPGTGKSFIGCRVVETYVRYKQLVASGDILQKISVDMLSDETMMSHASSWDRLLPQVGPVVVITYKNHALDEFLVDLLDSGLWDAARPRVGQQLSSRAAAAGGTSVPAEAPQDMFPGGRRLIRMGGRSRESRLDGHNLAAIMHASPANATIKSLKERVYVLHQRLEKLVEQVHHLECGREPRSYFERWLTTDQRQSISFDDKEAWLRGDRYVGLATRTNTDPKLYLKLLRTSIAAALAQGEQGNVVAVGSAKEKAVAQVKAAGAMDAGDEDVSLSVFQEMKREDERREFNDALHKHYISAEAIYLASHPPTRPASVPGELLSLWSLDPVARHEYYAFLIQQSIALKAKVCLSLMDAIANVVRIRNHAMDEAKLALLRGADVIGLTTTGCAMNQNLLRSLRPSVLVVEEAAEVLEAQLLACMTDSLEQIILIGDHYQLQPKVDTFVYEKVNKLNLSLFERLAREVPPIRLTEQRRMHPTISQLVRPFYDDQPLIDHASVLTRPFITTAGLAFHDGVPGLAKRVFFWRHDYPEEEAPGSRSKVNMRETLMARQISQHLVAEGVSQSSITVITPYLGQCRMLRSVLRMASLTDVRVSTVDLFQGDENDIIILSMTRTEKLTEFIRMRNRLIVSCSRARFAMVMVGNDALLRQSAHWAKVLAQLDADGCVGDRLPVTYRANPGEVSYMEVKETLSAVKVMTDIDAGSARPPPQTARVANSALDDDDEDDYGGQPPLRVARGNAGHGGNEEEDEGTYSPGEEYVGDGDDDNGEADGAGEA